MHFLSSIGLAVETVPGASGFIDGVCIERGGMRVDPGARASALLHEAGHLAIVPSDYRHHLGGDIDEGIARIFEEIDGLGLEPDHPVLRAMIQAGDSEATAWAWAAGSELGIPAALIIQDGEYEGEGASIRSALAANAYLGINGIAHAGFCVVRSNAHRDLPVYPKLASWLQSASV
ncbi:hypothetical protein VQ574_21735 (plasmid) [Stutzerimonas frequens]|uniref:hypothetical protein n=1 Tax=Stutzerimonas frequens TaxID=2968969 RepID=UPI002DBF46C1|nr:hypothetical protein [Stutzerimonas frequens]WRW29350.1 hypothetical protein VQ574_21735 [Stutzerimonas frequens]